MSRGLGRVRCLCVRDASHSANRSKSRCHHASAEIAGRRFNEMLRRRCRSDFKSRQSKNAPGCHELWSLRQSRADINAAMLNAAIEW